MRILFSWRAGTAPDYYGELDQDTWQPQARQMVYDALVEGRYEGLPDDPRPCYVHDYEAKKTFVSMPNLARVQMVWTDLSSEPWSRMAHALMPQDVLDQVEGAWRAEQFPDGPPDEPERNLRLLFLEVFHVQRCYGGPEEGGWYYDAGTRCRDFDMIGDMVEAGFSPKIYPDTARSEAHAEKHRLQKWLDETANKGRPPIYSVNSSGRYEAIIHDGEEVTHFPATRPHYE